MISGEWFYIWHQWLNGCSWIYLSQTRPWPGAAVCGGRDGSCLGWPELSHKLVLVLAVFWRGFSRAKAISTVPIAGCCSFKWAGDFAGSLLHYIVWPVCHLPSCLTKTSKSSHPARSSRTLWRQLLSPPHLHSPIYISIYKVITALFVLAFWEILFSTKENLDWLIFHILLHASYNMSIFLTVFWEWLW